MIQRKDQKCVGCIVIVAIMNFGVILTPSVIGVARPPMCWTRPKRLI